MIANDGELHVTLERIATLRKQWRHGGSVSAPTPSRWWCSGDENPLASERKIPDLAFPLALTAALGEQQYVLDRSPKRDGLTHFEDPGHRTTRLNAFPRVLGHRRYVVGEEYPLLGSGPLQHC